MELPRFIGLEGLLIISEVCCFCFSEPFGQIGAKRREAFDCAVNHGELQSLGVQSTSTTNFNEESKSLYIRKEIRLK